MRVNANNREQQASHFDVHPPFVPGADILRQTGFRYQYILKDVLLAQTVADLRIAPGARVLDVGCGIGVLLDRLGSTYRTSSFGVDVSRESLRRGRTESPLGIEAALCDALRLPFADNSIDLVISLDVLEHIDSPNHAISEVVRVLRPSGRFLCYAVSRRNRYTFNWFLATALDRLRVDHWAWSSHHPDLLVDPGDVRRYLRAAGCAVNRYEPFHAFFTIIFDQTLMVLYRIGAGFGLFHRAGKARRELASRLMNLLSSLCRGLLGTLQKWDSLWINRELSNGFLIVASKHAVNSPRVDLADQSPHVMEASRHPAPETGTASSKMHGVSGEDELDFESPTRSSSCTSTLLMGQERSG